MLLASAAGSPPVGASVSIGEREDLGMWAQMITMRLKQGKDDEMLEVLDLLRAAEPPGSGLVRSLTMRDQKDPNQIYTLVVFDSEESARARESNPQRQEQLAPFRAAMAEVFEGAPEFVDLAVVAETLP
jgi:quinol monooxygenase YgiN